MLRKELAIGGKDIGATKRPFLIAEISANHNNSLSRAKDLVKTQQSSFRENQLNLRIHLRQDCGQSG